MKKKLHFKLLYLLLLFSLTLSAQVKIGDNPTNVNSDAVLEIESADKGVLLPRVELTSTASEAPLSAHVEGMYVYNTAETGDVTPGNYYNDGTKWVRVIDGTSNLNWQLEGNAGTNPEDNFIGTTDGQDLVVKTNNETKAVFTNDSFANILVASDETLYDGYFNNPNSSDLYFGGVTAFNNTFSIYNFVDVVGSYGWNGNTASGTPENPGIPVPNALMSTTNGAMFDGAEFVKVARMRMHADGTPTASSLPTKITFWTTPVDSKTNQERLTIRQNGFVGIGRLDSEEGTNIAIEPTEKLDIRSGNVRIRDINDNTGDIATDSIVVADGDGVLKTVASSNFSNIYNADGTLTENRAVDLDGNSLTFNGPNQRLSLEEFTFRVQGAGPSGAIGNVIIEAEDTDDNGSRTALSLQAFADSDVRIFAGDEATGLNIGTSGTNQPTPIRFFTTGTEDSTEKARISPEGNLGIGTTNPSEKLDVDEGNVRIRDINDNTGDIETDNVVVADGDGVLKTVAVGDLAPAETNTTLALTAGELVYTNEEEDNLNVPLVSTDADNAITAGADDALFGENIYNADGTLTENRIITMDGNSLRMSNGGTSTLFSHNSDQAMITNIGVSRGAFQARGGNAALNMFVDDNAAAQLMAGQEATSLDVGTSFTDQPARIRFVTATTGGAAGTEKMRISAEGKVGIGTSNMLGYDYDLEADTSVLLAVNGSIITTNSIYADYVFEDYFEGVSKLNADYSFKSLTEVEQFINKNRHLPGVTKIDDLVKTNDGKFVINSTKLSVSLLEKVEELYLHTIEQQKEIEQQQEIIESKDKKLKVLEERQDKMEKRLARMEKLLFEQE